MVNIKGAISMKKYLFTTVAIVIILGFIYKESHFLIWGFNIPKSELSNIIIYTKENSYMVTDPNKVLELSKEISKMKKHSKISHSSSPFSRDQPSRFTQILIQTKNKVTYGGSFWDDGNNIVLDSNGYYWIATKDLFDLMDKSLKEAQKLY